MIESTVNLRELIANRDFSFIIGNLHPRRSGTLLFSTKLEYEHYRPCTPANDLFVPTKFDWPDSRTFWWVIRIPSKDLPIARQVAAQCRIQMKISHSLPHIMTEKGLERFPLSGPNVYSLTYLKEPKESVKELEQIEDDEIAKLTAIQKEWTTANNHPWTEGESETKIIGTPNLLLVVTNFDPQRQPTTDEIHAILLGDHSRALRVKEEYLKKPGRHTIDGYLLELGRASGFRSPTDDEIRNKSFKVRPIPWVDEHWAEVKKSETRNPDRHKFSG